MAADRAKQKCGSQVLRTWHDVGSAAAFAGSPEHGPFQGSPRGASGTAYLTMDPLSRPLALVTRSVHLRRFWQCSTCLSHSPSSVQCTFGPPRRVSSSLLAKSSPSFYPSFWWLLATLGVPWLVDTISTSIFSLISPLYACVSCLLFSKVTSHWL
uniref:Uncharacterized protein n=1 Tax=Ursus americanus TaxID=9643 RepID=A0A452RSA6_URSAM